MHLLYSSVMDRNAVRVSQSLRLRQALTRGVESAPAPDFLGPRTTIIAPLPPPRSKAPQIQGYVGSFKINQHLR
jgi:hypothetical protein